MPYLTHRDLLSPGAVDAANTSFDPTGLTNIDADDVQELGADIDALLTGVRTRVLAATFDGGGAVLTVGAQVDLYVPFGCTILEVTMLADQSGSAVVDIWKDTYANFPPTDADTITAAAPPTISTATKSQDSTLTGWTTAIAAGSILRFNVDSATDITRVSIFLKVRTT